MSRHHGNGPSSEFFVRSPHERSGVGRDVWSEAAASPEFARLRSRLLWFVMPATIGFLSWYLLYIVLSGWAPDLLGRKVVGGVTVVWVLAIGQFVSTFAITVSYSRYANRRLDPIADGIRTRLEDGSR
jgi:uncharacterized membrane protein (DUF485 family)